MNTSDMVFVGIKGSVLALNRATGEQVWATHLKGSDFVNVVVQDGAVLASCRGEIFCLDPLTGAGLWHNPLRGFGTGLATLSVVNSLESAAPPVVAEERRRNDAAAASSAAAAATM